jgi:iron complex outermembrane receptor protein
VNGFKTTATSWTRLLRLQGFRRLVRAYPFRFNLAPHSPNDICEPLRNWGIEDQFDVVHFHRRHQRAADSAGAGRRRLLLARHQLVHARQPVHAFAQNDVAVIGETPTAGYNLMRAEISYRTKLDSSWFGAREMTVGLAGNNLLNANNLVSYNKDEVLLPGIGVFC